MAVSPNLGVGKGYRHSLLTPDLWKRVKCEFHSRTECEVVKCTAVYVNRFFPSWADPAELQTMLLSELWSVWSRDTCGISFLPQRSSFPEIWQRGQFEECFRLSVHSSSGWWPRHFPFQKAPVLPPTPLFLGFCCCCCGWFFLKKGCYKWHIMGFWLCFINFSFKLLVWNYLDLWIN